MKLTLAEICKYGECTITSRNFSEGEKLLNADYLSKCGRLEVEGDVNTIMAYCRQYSAVNGKPHEIKGSINISGTISSFTCTCKAGLSEKCKHILALLLFCNR